jgi:hypothetical protein
MTHRAAVLAAMLLLLTLAPPPRPAAAHTSAQTGAGLLAAWVELGPGGAVIARVIVDRAACPNIDLNGQPRPMQVRAGPSAAFAVLVCELTVPPGTTSAVVEGRALPLPRPNPQRIVVLGDTGCRIASFAAQACNDPAAWPWARVARSAASFAPDLVIHVGDYLYREAPCPTGFAGCAGSPFGDNWPTWQADFFGPAEPLLRAAPWVVVRGNHEDCNREGLGWFRFLDPRPLPAGCDMFTEPYAVPLGDLQLLVFDDSAAPNGEPPPDMLAIYTAQVARARALAGDRAWFLVHTGVRVIGHLGVQNGVEQLYRNSVTLAAAGALDLPPGVQLHLGGHTHLFEALGFNPPRPPQLISGNAGTQLDDPVTTPLAGLPVFDTTVAFGTNAAQFGYLTGLPLGRGWSFTERDVNGAAVTTCAVADLTLRCAPGVVVPGQSPPPPSGQPGTPCTTVVGGHCTASGAVSGAWNKTSSGTYSFSAAAPATVAPSGTPAIFLPTTVGVESYPCAALAAAPPFTATCQGATRGDVLQGATVTIRFPVAGGGFQDVTGTITGPGPASVALQQALGLVQPTGQRGVPCAVGVGQTCQATGAVTGPGTVTGSMRWSLTATVPAGVAAGIVPVAVFSTSQGRQGFPCAPVAAGAATVACAGTTPANALQTSTVTVVFAPGVVAVGVIRGPGAGAAAVPLLLPPPISPSSPPIMPPLLLPPPPLPPLVPVQPGAPTGAPSFPDVPVIPEADSLMLLILALAAVGAFVGVDRRPRRG